MSRELRADLRTFAELARAFSRGMRAYQSGDEGPIREWVREFVGAEPDAFLKTILLTELLPNYPDDVPFYLFCWHLRSHAARISGKEQAQALPDQAAATRSNFRLQGSHKFALDVLRNGGAGERPPTREETLRQRISAAIVEHPHEAPADLRTHVGNSIRREARNEMPAAFGSRMKAKLKGHDGEAEELVAFISAESARQDIERLRKDADSVSMSKSEKETFDLLLEGHRIVDIAQMRNRTREQISQEKYRIRKKIVRYRRVAGQ